VKTVLLLGGTAEARAFAKAFAIPGARLVASLAGMTTRPLAYPCAMRHGGFGGVDGLRAYLRNEAIAALVDATHPFATGMSRNAAQACAGQAVPNIALTRPPWPPVGDWHSFASLRQAVDALPPGARVLATTGRKDIGPYAARPDLAVFLRSVDPPDAVPAHVVPLVARAPFAMASETAGMTRHGITHLVTRNAGGESRARLDAAVALGLPLHIVERPPMPVARTVHSVADALRWLQTVLRD